MKYQPIIGLEVHVELKTKSKMFCRCLADYFGKEPNTHTCPVCLGLPGALPVPNKQAIEWCVMIGMALGCEIPLFSKFDRKNYFYPDLPKGYQISQYDEPFCINGFITLSNGKKIRIRRVHMEEDTAKLTHQPDHDYSLIDFNRSGVPLVEIVTVPDFESATEVKEYLMKLQQIVRYLGVSNADMEKGDMRLEPNISLSINKDQLPNYKVEVKNINSFRFVEKAIEYEIQRQQELLDEGKRPAQETRGWDEKKNRTVSQRLKEEANDYRYFPEPDIPPIHWTDKQLSQIKNMMPELPEDKGRKLIQLGLSTYNAQVSTATIERAEFIEKAIEDAKKLNIDPKGVVNFILNRRINDIDKITPVEAVEEYKNLSQVAIIDESELEKTIQKVLSENPKAVLDYKSGKESVIMFLVGQVMRNFTQKIDAQLVKQKLTEKLAS